MHCLGLVHGHFVASRFVSLTDHGRDPFNQNFTEISVQNAMDRFGPTRKVSEKLVHLLRWTTCPGRTGLNFG